VLTGRNQQRGEQAHRGRLHSNEQPVQLSANSAQIGRVDPLLHVVQQQQQANSE
jgi:hypothetical protein